MAITAAVCSSFKSESLQGIHLAADVYKIALFPSTATLSAATAVYAATGECPATGNYALGGIILAGYSGTLQGTVGVIDFTTAQWPTSTITARGALIYNSTKAGKAVAVLDFGADITSTNGTFQVAMPAVGAGTSLIRFQ